MPVAGYCFRAAAVNDQIYVMGGITGAFVVTELKDQNEQYTPVGYIPEFPAWILLLLFVVGTCVIVICKKKAEAFLPKNRKKAVFNNVPLLVF